MPKVDSELKAGEPVNEYNSHRNPRISLDEASHQNGHKYSRDRSRTDGRIAPKPSFSKTPDTFQGEGDTQWKNWEEYSMHYNVVSDWNAWNEVE